MLRYQVIIRRQKSLNLLLFLCSASEAFCPLTLKRNNSDISLDDTVKALRYYICKAQIGYLELESQKFFAEV